MVAQEEWRRAFPIIQHQKEPESTWVRFNFLQQGYFACSMAENEWWIAENAPKQGQNGSIANEKSNKQAKITQFSKHLR